MHDTRIKINKRTGDMEIVYHPSIEPAIVGIARGLKIKEARRGAHVYPKNKALRFAFKALRRIYGNAGAVAAWTRRWPGKWELVAPKGQTFDKDFGTFESHDAAVEAEVEALIAGVI